MQAVYFLKEVEKLSSPVFFLNDVARIIGKSSAYAGLYIHRLRQKNLVYEIEKGKYALSNDPFEVSSGLLFPSYISFISAYYIYGMTTQMPIVVQIVAAKSKKPVNTGNGRIEFIKFKNKNIFGYTKKDFRGKYIFLAEPEKSIVDSLYLPECCPISESFEALKNPEIDKEKILDYALKMDSIVTLKRLGYLMELNGMDIYEQIKNKLNNRYDPLNPFIKRSKNNSSKWKLNINERLT